MTFRQRLERIAQKLADLCFKMLPRKRPSRQALKDCKLVSHRGEHDNELVRENTLAAFDPVVAAGVWGIEFDVHWTKDLEPIVIHDANTLRVFGSEIAISDVTLRELRDKIPEIPTLAEIVTAYGGKTHLMIELKSDRLGNEETKASRLQEVLSILNPKDDYHFLALEPDRFSAAPFVEPETCLLISETNTAEISEQVLSRNLGGICGHYLLLNESLAEQHRAKGQQVGTGFATSRFGFYREVNRGVDWIFTNHALKLCRIRNRLLGAD